LTKFNHELAVRQSPAGKYLSMETEGIVEIRERATTSENI
jgi:hypothetical protein